MQRNEQTPNPFFICNDFSNYVTIRSSTSSPQEIKNWFDGFLPQIPYIYHLLLKSEILNDSVKISWKDDEIEEQWNSYLPIKKCIINVFNEAQIFAYPSSQPYSNTATIPSSIPNDLTTNNSKQDDGQLFETIPDSYLICNDFSNYVMITSIVYTPEEIKTWLDESIKHKSDLDFFATSLLLESTIVNDGIKISWFDEKIGKELSPLKIVDCVKEIFPQAQFFKCQSPPASPKFPYTLSSTIPFNTATMQAFLDDLNANISFNNTFSNERMSLQDAAVTLLSNNDELNLNELDPADLEFVNFLTSPEWNDKEKRNNFFKLTEAPNSALNLEDPGEHKSPEPTTLIKPSLTSRSSIPSLQPKDTPIYSSKQRNTLYKPVENITKNETADGEKVSKKRKRDSAFAKSI